MPCRSRGSMTSSWHTISILLLDTFLLEGPPVELSQAPSSALATCAPDAPWGWGQHCLAPMGTLSEGRARRPSFQCWLPRVGSNCNDPRTAVLTTQGWRGGQGRDGCSRIQGALTKTGHAEAAVPFLSVSVAWTSRISPDPPRTSGPSSPCKDNSTEGMRGTQP